jgi:hypothetical protein
VAFSHGYFRARFARLLAGSMAASIFCIIAWLRLQNGCYCGTIGQKASARGHHTRSIECQRRFRLLERLNLRTALAGGGSMFYAGCPVREPVSPSQLVIRAVIRETGTVSNFASTKLLTVPVLELCAGPRSAQRAASRFRCRGVVRARDTPMQKLQDIKPVIGGYCTGGCALIFPTFFRLSR